MTAAPRERHSRRRGIRTATVRDEQATPAPDLVGRNFVATAPDVLWIADITYVPTLAGFLYLACVLDVCMRRVVGWAMRTTLATEIVTAALDMAVARARPAAGLIHHSRPRLVVHQLRLRPPLPRGRHRALDGIGRRRIRQGSRN